MIYNPNIPPPNGFIFRDIDGTLIKGSSWKSLERKVVAYRKQAGGSVDNVLDEIFAQVCAAAPEYCKSPKTSKPKKDARSAGTVKSVVFKYLSKLVHAKEIRKVGAATVAERVATCKGCPFRAHVEVGCSTCRASITAIRKQILGSTSMTAPGLGVCNVSKVDLAVAVHVDEPREGNPELPGHCWRKL